MIYIYHNYSNFHDRLSNLIHNLIISLNYFKIFKLFQNLLPGHLGASVSYVPGGQLQSAGSILFCAQIVQLDGEVHYLHL